MSFESYLSCRWLPVSPGNTSMRFRSYCYGRRVLTMAKNGFSFSTGSTSRRGTPFLQLRTRVSRKHSNCWDAWQVTTNGLRHQLRFCLTQEKQWFQTTLWNGWTSAKLSPSRRSVGERRSIAGLSHHDQAATTSPEGDKFPGSKFEKRPSGVTVARSLDTPTPIVTPFAAPFLRVRARLRWRRQSRNGQKSREAVSELWLC
ncbi:hypothetical protein CSUI_009654, partial [Cystoisospora suis]